MDTATSVEEVKSQKAANWGSETGVQEAWRGWTSRCNGREVMEGFGFRPVCGRGGWRRVRGGQDPYFHI